MLSFSARQIRYSCILKSDVMNVTVLACVVGLVFMVKYVYVYSEWAGTKDSALWMLSLINIGVFWQRFVVENIQRTVYLNLHTVCGSDWFCHTQVWQCSSSEC